MSAHTTRLQIERVFLFFSFQGNISIWGKSLASGLKMILEREIHYSSGARQVHMYTGKRVYIDNSDKHTNRWPCDVHTNGSIYVCPCSCLSQSEGHDITPPRDKHGLTPDAQTLPSSSSFLCLSHSFSPFIFFLQIYTPYSGENMQHSAGCQPKKWHLLSTFHSPSLWTLLFFKQAWQRGGQRKIMLRDRGGWQIDRGGAFS